METKARTKRSAEVKLPVLRLRSPLGLALERYRQAKGLGLNELARLAKVDPAQLSRLEGASQVSAHAATLRRLAKALDMDIELLMRLNALSREHDWTTENAEDLLLEGIAAPATGVEAAIERDPTIPAKRKKWLRECVALARK
jgi:transcriptional regulator with XRE-family HTH domain